MAGTRDLWAFLAASFLLWLTPGPDTMYILARSIARGRRAGVMSALGIGTGLLIHTFLAAFGLSAILATSAWGFVAVKTAGAGYLIVREACMSKLTYELPIYTFQIFSSRRMCPRA